MGQSERAEYVQLLGSVRVRAGPKWLRFSPDKRYGLLAYLAYSGDWVSRESVAHLFWPDTSTEKAQQNLRQLLHRVRTLAWLKDLEVEKHRLRWNVETDVAAFKRSVEQDHLDEALSLYRGPLLEGATLVSRLVQACPHLDLLVTSRERLNLVEEWLLAVEGLPYPESPSLPTWAVEKSLKEEDFGVVPVWWVNSIRSG